MNLQISIHFISKLKHLIDFAQNLAYALGNDIGERYEEWLKDVVNMLREGPEAKVTTAILLHPITLHVYMYTIHPRTSIANTSQARQPLMMWKDARGDEATPSAMVAALKKIGPMTTQIRQKIEKKFPIQDLS